MAAPGKSLLRLLKLLAFLLCLWPAALLAWKGFHNQLGANPIDVITRATGKATLVLLMVTLSVTPIRKLAGLPWLVRFRRMLGLFAFFYGTLHLMTYVWLDKFFDFADIAHDITVRRFITMGVLAWLSMVPLALTSTAGWIRRLGGRRWQNLHRLIYLSAAAGVIHFIWLVKADERQPFTFGAILLCLLAYRFGGWLVGKLRGKAPTSLPNAEAGD